MAHILIAEDETAINNLIRSNLKLVGHSCAQAFTGPEALELARSQSFDLVLLDVMLPGLDGFAVKVKLPADLPVIFVTAKTSLSDKLQGLGLGAEDYIVKPFEVLELLARVEIVLRRGGKSARTFTLDGLRVDLDAHRVFLHEEEIPLTPQEYSLLEVLITNRNLALSREKLLNLAWGYDYEGESRTVDAHIQRLRKKLELEGRIQTVYKLGYRLSTR